jgi:hypothetical protein
MSGEPAAPRIRRSHSRNYDRRVRGESYRSEIYDDMVGQALEKVAASALLMTETMQLVDRLGSVDTDNVDRARIAADREHATARYLRDRDVIRLQDTMRRLDDEEAAVRPEPIPAVTVELARQYLANLARLWRDTTDEGKRAIAEAAFERIDALGLDLVIHPSAEAERYGWAEAFGPDPIVCSIGQSGRGERACASHTDLSVERIRLVPTAP